MSPLARQDRIGMVGRISEPLWDRLVACCSDVKVLDPRVTMTRAGAPVTESVLLLDGLMVRQKSNSAGARLLVSLQLPGDFVDLHAMPLGRLDHDVVSVGKVRIALFPHAAIQAIMDDSAEHARALWALTMIDASIHRHWTFRLGRLRAIGRVANFLCEMDLRMKLCGRSDGEAFPLTLTQADLAEFCGLSPVHVNRVLKELRDAGLFSLRDGHATVLDRAGLVKIGDFDPDYLFLPWTPGAA